MATTKDERWAAYDALCKKLLSEKAVLAKILKECVPEFKTCSEKDIMAKYIQGTPEVSSVNVMPDETNAPTRISAASIEDTLETEGKITYDIRFDAKAPNSGEQIGLIINIEAQHNYDPGYKIIRRGIYYCSRMISAQHGTVFTNSDYNKIKKVYSIWICTEPPADEQNSIAQYEMRENLIMGNIHKDISDYDLATVILIHLSENGDLCGVDILDFLATLLNRLVFEKDKRTVLREKYNVELTDTLMREVDEMCDLGKGLHDKGVRLGMQQGIETGKAEMLRRYLESGATIEEAFEIFKITDSEEQARLREALATV